jgi:hypothetical protein
MKRKLTKDQRKALERYNFALREEDRFMGSVFASSVGQKRVEEKTRLAHESCKRLGMTYEHGL